ncbi:hypothetical protein [Cellulomonas pakistanensis]|uniref:Uncharacterized protein n=1 Tax=Cellulomonas pakistanensis TaxID=992287 RepID=A0A919P7I6_9CELL|nr:hypothetical protein [Cellulomonas pakistanensis]GIG35038.1 hypothetical protein Cpa01nite_04190 [Cellulomonas pakistanensis]
MTGPSPAAPGAGPATTPSRPVRPRGPLAVVPTAVLAAATLVAAFAVAQGTGVRALGGVVLVLGVAWCAWRSWSVAGAARVVAVVALGAACFVGSHVLAETLGAWATVVLAAAVLGAGAWLLVDRRP